MRVLVLESISGLRAEIDTHLFPEGFGMLRTMVDEFSRAGFDVVTTLNRKLEPFVDWLDADVYHEIDDALKKTPDAALVIAPEKGGELEIIIARLRKRGIPVLGAQERAVHVSADKWLAYLALKGKVPQPKTWRAFPRVRKKVLMKPIDGIGCEGVELLSSHPGNDGVIFQEFLNGEHRSCCLLMGKDQGTVLSVNKQSIAIRGGKFEYSGSEIPQKLTQERRCIEVALRAARSLGMWGYCGVDLVVAGAPYFIELNPRVTASFVALARTMRANLGELLVNVFDGVHPSAPKLTRYSIVKILKAGRGIRVDEKRKLDSLREIPEIVSPPLAIDGYQNKDVPMLVAASGINARRAKRELAKAAMEVFSKLEVH